MRVSDDFGGVVVLTGDERLEADVLVSEEVLLAPVRNSNVVVVPDVIPGPDLEDHVELLQRELLGLRHEEVDKEESHDVETGVETKGSGRGQGGEHSRESDREDGRPTQICRDRPSHSLFSLSEREDLSGVGERNGTLSRRINGSEEEDEEGNDSDLHGSSDIGGLVRDEESETGTQDRESHSREGEEKKCSSTITIDGEDGGEGENEVNSAETEGREQCLLLRGSSKNEDGRGVEGDDVDSAHLLTEHDNSRCDSSSSNTGNREELHSSSEVVIASDDLSLLHELDVNVVDISGGLKFRESKSAERFPGFGVSVLLHEPTGRFRAEIDSYGERQSGDES